MLDWLCLFPPSLPEVEIVLSFLLLQDGKRKQSGLYNAL